MSASDHEEEISPEEKPKKEKPLSWGNSKKSFQKISSEEALAQIKEGKELKGVEFATLDLRRTKVSHSIVLEECQVENLYLEGSDLEKEISIQKTTFTGEVILSQKDKPEELRESTFYQKVQFHKVDFQGVFICEQASFRKEFYNLARFAEKASFRFSEFHEDANLSNSLAEKELELIKCHFQGNAWFRDLRCQGDASFRRSTFGKKSNFRGACFQKSLYLTDVNAGQRAGLNSMECQGPVEFDRSHFAGEVSSKGTKYQGKVSFRSCEIEGPLFFHNSSFQEQLALNNLQLKGKLQTTEATFKGRVLLDKVRLEQEVDFSKATFGGDFFCRKSVLGSFESPIHFSQTCFEREVDFADTSFLATTHFTEAIFKHKTSFLRTNLGIPEGLVSFEKAKFIKKTKFERAHFVGRTLFNDSSFEHQISFNRAIFDHLCSFVGVNFAQKTSFTDVHFLKQTFFYRSKFNDAEFINTEFEGAACFSYDKQHLEENAAVPCQFLGSVNFIHTRFLKKALFQKVEFSEKARFDYAYFGEQASFRRAVFKKDAIFTGVFCSLELDLRRINVGEELLIKGANINRRLNLADATFSRIGFYNMVTDVIAVTPEQIKGKLRGEYSKTKDPEEMNRTAQEFLILKKSFSYQGMHEEEDWAYWNSRRTLRRTSTVQARKSKNIFILMKNFLERIIIDYGSSYGTHPLRITFLACCLIVCFGAFYWVHNEQIILEGDEILPGHPKANLTQCIYFSTMAFTTMGFGDIHPNIDGWLKGVVALEALVGIITMTLFVGTYARKIIR